MHIKPIWRYFNRGLLIILSILIIFTLAAIIYLVHSLLGLRDLLSNGSSAVATALVLQDIEINVQSAQSSSRGYVITGDKSYLASFNAAKQRLPGDLNMLKSNKRILLSAAERNQIADNVSQQMTLFQRGIDLYDSQGFDATKAAIQRGHGQQLMHDLKAYITRISSRDLQNIGPMERSTIAGVRIALWVAVGMSVLVLGISGAILWYFRKAILHERALESTKNEFLSLASHQLRTPATNVKQYIALLLDGYMGDITDQQRHALEVAYKSNESEIRIMNTLLDVAKLDLNRIELHKKVTNLAKIVRRVLRDYSPVADDRSLEIATDIPTQLMATIDEGYIEGVFQNLLDNAIKYSRPGTRITVKVWRDQDMACVSVRDQGVGMRKRDLSRLFTKFTRLDNEFSASSEGSGLGLYWVSKVVGLHRGKVELASRENKGSIFIVRLPIR